MRTLITCIWICFFSMTIYGQTAVVQPKIMVIPYTTGEQDIRTILETDVNKRIAVTKIKEAFDARGFTTVDFVARLKAAQSAQVFNSENRSDIKSQIIEMSGADIYVEAEINYTTSSTGNDVKLIITAYECSTGGSLANKIGESGKFYTTDVAKLTTRAINSCADEFLNTLQAKFTDIVENGKSILLQIGFDENSAYTMESEVGSQGLLWQSPTAIAKLREMLKEDPFRRDKIEFFSRPPVYFVLYAFDELVGEVVEVGLFWDVSSDEFVCVLDGPLLPGRIRVCEIDGDFFFAFDA